MQALLPARGWARFVTRVRFAFSHPRFPIVAAAVAVALSIPVLWSGLFTDDYHHRAAILGMPTGGYLLRGDIAHLYSFADGNREHTMALGEAGDAPWWGDPAARVSFFRPLSALSQRVDYWLWPDRPGLMHAQSLAWLFAAVVAAGALYRRLFGAVAAAGVAVLLFAFDDAHATPAAWLAQRNTLLAVFFGVLALVAHHRLRGEGWRPGLVAAPGLFAVALLSGESGITALAYLIAYAVFLDAHSLKSRGASLLPYVGVVAVWRLATQAAGYGAANVGYYIDPGAEPLRFLAALAFRLPILFLGLFSPINSNLALLGPPGTAAVLFGLGLVAMALVVGLLWPLLRRDTLARFFTLGMFLSFVPSCAAYPGNRMLMWSGLGAMGLVARFLVAFLARDGVRLPLSRGYRLVGGSLAVGLAAVHLVVAPIQRVRSAVGDPAVSAQLYIRPLKNPALARESLVVVNGPLVFFASHLRVMQAAEGRPIPAHLRILAPSFAAVELDRPGERVLVVRPSGGYLAQPMDLLYRSLEKPMPVGYRVQFSDVTIEVTSLTPDGRPAAIACRFRVPLEDRSLRWMFWEKGRYRNWTPPPVHGSVVLPAAVPVI